MNSKNEQTQRAEVIVGWLNRLWAHYRGKADPAQRVTSDNFNAMAHEVQNFTAGLCDYPPEIIDQAFSAHLLSSRWMPKLAEIRELAEASRLSGQHQEDEYRAWESLCMALKHESPAGPMPCFHDQTIPQVINDLGGWRHVALRDSVELQTFVRKEFLHRYKALTQSRLTQQLLQRSSQTAGLLSGCQAGSTNRLQQR
ncbi:MAG: hypothetical protein IBX50_07700 [Marinospirillum sp.]|uniref:DUF6475 domain-containing protein n=1 Tax=Marinospirillum sp. TaxID=2183934 RepID=UPI0019F63C1C|nr:DUF6475 domain-containing protein [Marinospirillum sp.]MBE0506591.1 hypothetical protein [Marinospirillum sp.]